MNDMSTWLNGFYELNPEAKETEEVDIKKANILSLPDILEAMDLRDLDFYKNLSPEQKKEVSFWLLMRYMSSSGKNIEHHLMMVNDLVNYNFSALMKHPELQWMLLALCGTGKIQNHRWIPPPKGIKKNKLEEEILRIYPLLKDDELEMILTINSQEELIQFFKDNGYDDKTIKELFKGK
jgi:hypothetical protein